MSTHPEKTGPREKVDFGHGVSKEDFLWDGDHKTKAHHHHPKDDIEPQAEVDPITDEKRSILRDLLAPFEGPGATLAARFAAFRDLAGADLRSRGEIAGELGISPQRYQEHLEVMARKIGIPWRQRVRARKAAR